MAFRFASFADINQGVIASLFTSGVIFTSILFYFIYDEALNRKDLVGIIFILAGVGLIGFGKEHQTSTNVAEAEEKYQYLWLSILFAIICGLSFAINSFVMKHYV